MNHSGLMSRWIAASVLCAAHSAFAFGEDLRVNTYTTGDQQLPRIASSSTGAFVVVWQSDGEDGDKNGVFARRYAGTLTSPLGTEFRVNTYTTGQQYTATVAMDGSGSFVVAWESYSDFGTSEILAQRFAATGAPIGGEFRVNTTTASFHRDPAVGMSSGGGFVVVWTSSSPSRTLFLQRYDAGGARLGGELQVNTYTTGSHYAGRVAVTPTGDFVVVWASSLAGSNDVRARRFSASGAPLGSDFRVNETPSTGTPTEPAVAVDAAGDFMVVWVSYSGGAQLGVFARRYSSSAAPLTAEFRVATYTTGPDLHPDVSVLASGGFAVVWGAVNNQDGSASGVFARTFTSAGTPEGSDFQVNGYTTLSQDSPSLAPDGSGGFVTVWRTDGLDGSGKGIAAKVTDPGTPSDTDDIRVNTYTTGVQSGGRVAYDSQGNFVIVWGSNALSAYHNVFAQGFAAGGVPVGAEFRVNSYTTGDEMFADIAFVPGGEFVVVWTDLKAGIGDVMARRFDAALNPLTGEFRVNTYTTRSQDNPRVSSGPTGFVVVWQSYTQTGGDNEDIIGKRFSATGAPLGGEFFVNTYTTGQQDHPGVAVDGSGNFVVVWESFQQEGPTLTNVYMQRFSSAGARLGVEFRVNTYTSVGVTADEPTVASDALGHAVVAWSQGPGSQHIFARRFGPDGAPEGPEFHIDTYTSGPQVLPLVARSPDGEFVIAWQQGVSYDTIAQRYARSGGAIGAAFRVNTYTTGSADTPTGLAMDSTGEFVVVYGGYDGDSTGVFRRRYPALVSGDVDGNGVVDIADVFYLINFLFAGGAPPLGEADADGSYALDVADVFYLINFLFVGGPAPQ